MLWNWAAPVRLDYEMEGEERGPTHSTMDSHYPEILGHGEPCKGKGASPQCASQEMPAHHHHILMNQTGKIRITRDVYFEEEGVELLSPKPKADPPGDLLKEPTKQTNDKIKKDRDKPISTKLRQSQRMHSTPN